MEPTIFKYILRYSKREQVMLVLVTFISFPFLYVSLDLPKIIINEAIGGQDFPRAVLGFELEQIPFLLALCGLFLILVFVNGGFKYFINVYRGIVGERMLRRLRYTLYRHVLRFPLPHFRRMSQGEIVSMVTAETEPVGGFTGESIALPAFQGGTLLTILVFMFVQDPVLGIAAIALYPIQGYLIPKLQMRVNRLKKDRVMRIRRLSERVGEVVTGIQEVHAHDTSQLELADYAKRMAEIYVIRLQIYKLKYLIKFLNNFIAQLTPFFFFSIGGYLVINGDLTFGALVAVLAAYKDLSSPWKELLGYYQRKEDVRIKYELLVETFQPAGMLDEKMQDEEPAEVVALSGDVVATNLNLAEEEDDSDATAASGTSFRFNLPRKVAVVGEAGSGKEQLAHLLARLRMPVSGRISINGTDLARLPESVTGRRMAYVAQEPRLRVGTVLDNLWYPLKHRPLLPANYQGEEADQREWEKREAAASGNTEYDLNADWIDYQAAGVEDAPSLVKRTLDVLRMVEMEKDVYQFGLQGFVAVEQDPSLVERIMAARRTLRDKLRQPEVAALVESFDRETYNANMTVAENILFGTPRDKNFDVNNLAANPYVRKVLWEKELMADLVLAGRELAELMVELFADVDPDSEMFAQYSFISAEDLPDFRALIGRTEGLEVKDIEREDRVKLLAMTFKLIPAQHRLHLVDEAMQQRLLEVRRAFAEGFGEGRPEVEFFDPEKYNAAVSVQDNILFGRLAYGRARAAATVGQLINQVVEELALHDEIMGVGLNHEAGLGGTRLNNAQRQKVAIARCVLKRPDVLIVDQATATLDGSTQETIKQSLFAEFEGRGLVWVLHRADLAKEFQYTVVMNEGRVAAEGEYAELNRPGTPLNQLVMAG